MTIHFSESYLKVDIKSLKKLITISDIKQVNLVLDESKSALESNESIRCVKLLIELNSERSSALKPIFSSYMSFGSLGVLLSDFDSNDDFFMSILDKVSNFSIRKITEFSDNIPLLQFINYKTSSSIKKKRRKEFLKKLYIYDNFIVCYNVLVISFKCKVDDYYSRNYYDHIHSMICKSSPLDFESLQYDILKKYFLSNSDLYMLTPITGINFKNLTINRKNNTTKYYEFIDDMINDCILYKIIDEAASHEFR